MPLRKPAATSSSTPPPTASASTSRVHRSQESNYGVGQSHHSLANAAIQQQKIVQVLVNRLKNKLPIHSGTTLDRLETDQATQQAVEALVKLSHDSLDTIALALCELVERLAKAEEMPGIELLQSQLFVLKVLATAITSRTQHSASGVRSRSQASSNPPGSIPESPIPQSSSKWSRTSADNNLSLWGDTPPMEDNCARYLLSVMVLFLRQSGQRVPTLLMDHLESTDIDFRDYETVPRLSIASVLEAAEKFEQPDLKTQSSYSSLQSSLTSASSFGSSTYELTPVSMANSQRDLHDLIEHYTGRIVFHISVSNWATVFNRIRMKIRQLAQQEPDADIVDVSLLSFCAMDRRRLVQFLQELSSLLVNMSVDTHLIFANPLRLAIWNWIRNFPKEYNDLLHSTGKVKMDGAPERVFDSFYSRIKAGTEATMWPTLAALLCITPERISADISVSRGTKSDKFVQEILRNFSVGSKHFDVAVICGLDMCRATMVSTSDDILMRSFAIDIVHELKGNLFNTHTVRPFWDNTHHTVDIALFAEVLVALHRFLPPEESAEIFLIAIEPDRSDAVKTCVIRALKTITVESSRYPLQADPVHLSSQISRRLREMMMTVCIRRAETDKYGNMKRTPYRPKSKHASRYGLSDREILCLGILSLWRVMPLMVPDEYKSKDWTISVLEMWDAPYDNAVKNSLAVNSRLGTEYFLPVAATDAATIRSRAFYLEELFLRIMCLASNLLRCRSDPGTQRAWLQMDIDHLALSVTNIVKDPSTQINQNTDRLAAFILSEIALLVCLPSQDNDISQLAAQGLRLISFAERGPFSSLENPLMTTDDLSKRIPVYDQIGDPKVNIQGRNMRQKRVRRLLRLAPFSPAVSIAVWQECYWRWRALGETVVHGTDSGARGRDQIQGVQDIRAEWQNLALFLAAMGGSCLRDLSTIINLTDFIPATYIPDGIRVPQNPVGLVQGFVRDLSRYLLHDDILIRDTARDALGTELDPKLYGRLIRHLEEAVETTKYDSSDRSRLIGEQAISVLKLIVENKQERLEEVINVDVSPLLQGLAGFLQTSTGGVDLLRLKTKFCNLCETAADRPDTLTLKKDNQARRVILNIVSSWITTQAADDDSAQSELNIACLRTIVKLLQHLDLKDADTTTGMADEGTHQAARQFNKYFKILQNALTVAGGELEASDSMSDIGSIQRRMSISVKEAELRDLVITGLSHLVGSDPEVGLKQCLDLAYGEDFRGRAIFAHVFAKVIGQGTKFEAADQIETTDRYKRLCDLVKEPNLVLVQAICETCPSHEVDKMVSILLNIFHTRSSLMLLLKFMINREVNQTENEAGLFRSNSIYNRFLSAFARVQGYHYLRQLILPIVRAMADLPPGQGYELDPAKVAAGQDLAQNQLNVQFLTTKFLDLIYSSRTGLPPMVREVCSHITDAVSHRWPAQSSLRITAVGAFLFLRFISPAVVAPEIIDIELPNDSLRRGLMIIAKIIQNLANNVLFGKEPHMTRLNEFLAQNIKVVTQFVSIIVTERPDDEDKDEWLGSTNSDDTDGIVLHRFFDKHADKIGKELLSISKPVVESDTSGISGKRTWDTLCTLLVDLGQPLEAPRSAKQDSRTLKDYIDLRARYESRPKTSVEHIFAPVRNRNQKVSLFVYRPNQIDGETVDIELVLSHMFQVLERSTTDWDIIIDGTAFATKNVLALHWVKYSIELFPTDFLDRLRNIYILNANMEALKYIKRLTNFGCPSPGNVRYFMVPSVEALMEHIPDVNLEDLGYPAALEQESFEEFAGVTMKISSVNPNQPNIMRVAASHVRITCLSSPGATEIIPMTDISDAYVTGTRDRNEFIIRRNRMGTTLYLNSLSNDLIVKSIRAAKSRIAGNHTSYNDRFSRFSNIPATLLHVGMLNIDVRDEEVRTAAYELLGAVCTYLGYDKSPIVSPNAGFIPGDPSVFVVQLSERVAEFAPQLTLDFISEVAAAMNMEQKAHGHIGATIGSLYYLSPWIKNFTHFANPVSPLFDRSATRLRDCIRGLSDLCLSYPELRSPMQKHIWGPVAGLDPAVVDIVLDELIRGAIDSGAGTTRCEAHAHIIASFSSIAVRGKLFSKLRKVIIKASPRQSRSLVESPNWNEVSTLSRVCLIAGYQTKNQQHNQLYIPEVVHCVMMIAGLGSTIVRKSVYGILVNLLQSLYLTRTEDPVSPDLVNIMTEVQQEHCLQLFGLKRSSTSSEYTRFDPTLDSVVLNHHEELAQFLLKVIKIAAGNKGLTNVWRARWMSLVTSSAFQYSSMIQMRSFTVLSVLATSHLDEDFFYQALVAFSSALTMMDPSDSLAPVGILRALSSLLRGLPEETRFLPQLFWMGVSFLQTGYVNFFVEAARLVETTLQVMDQRELFRDSPMSTFLLDARTHIEDLTYVFDINLGLSFDSSFSFAFSAIVFKGMRRSGEIKEAAISLLRTILRVTMRYRDVNVGKPDSVHPDVLGYFIALLPVSTTQTEYRALLKGAGLKDTLTLESEAISFDDEYNVPMPTAAFLDIHQNKLSALFATSFISAILITAQGDDAETQILYGILSNIALTYPGVVSMAYESLQDKVKDTFANASNASIIRYVSDIIRVALQDDSVLGPGGSASTVGTADEPFRLGKNHLNALDEHGMTGLGNHFKFLPPSEGFDRIVPHLVKIVESIAQPLSD